MELKIYQVDAFSDKLFGGNPAAVVLLDKPMRETLMQAIAAENNLAETAFIVPAEGGFDIRWFTPTIEVDLCGHATLAAAHVVFNYLDYEDDIVVFYSLRSGTLTVRRIDDILSMDFPADKIEKIPTPAELSDALGIEPMETYKGKTDYMAVVPSEKHLTRLRPDIAKIAALDVRGVIVTAAGTGPDFVSRFFAPQSGVAEDPVTGSAHTTLTVYWAKELAKDMLIAEQLSARKGKLYCRYAGNRVHISGHAVTFLKGTIEVPDLT